VAELVEENFRPWVQVDKVKHILDIGTGCACIAIACAVAFPGASVDAIDISPAALEVARKNVKAYKLEDRVNLIKSDLYEVLAGEKYDLIIANPPYVDAGDMQALPPEFRHEPRLALVGGDDGLDLVRRIISDSGRHMNKGAVLVVEVGNSQQAMESAFPDLPMVWLDFERGGDGVFLITAEELKNVTGY
jgi:ribosomal protein L3 glutamine methyltransferase